MTAMNKELLKKESIQTYGQSFWKTSLFKNGNKCSCDNDSKSVKSRTESLVLRNSSSEISWLQYAFYIHILVLYVLLFSVYSELERTKETMYDFHMNMINISMKGLEVEKNCLSEISNFRSSLRLNGAMRPKREIPEPVTTSKSVDFFNDISDEDTPHLRVPRKAPKQGRGNENKKNRKHRRRRCHSKHACGFPRATHFIGALPEPIIKDGGLLAPWLVDKNAINDFSLNTKVPSRGREAVEITESGLYFIYSQVYYMSPNDSAKAHSSFYIMLRRGGEERVLSQCATLGDSQVGGEASCFTAAAQSLFSGDLVFLKQRERDRHITMKRGQTFLGLVLLNKRPNNKSTEITPTISTAYP